MGIINLYFRVTGTAVGSLRSLRFEALGGTTNVIDSRVTYHQAQHIVDPSLGIKKSYTMEHMLIIL